jgi:flagellar assembly protein FliH
MNAKEDAILANNNSNVQTWILPGITGNSINSKHNKSVNYVDPAKEEEERRAEIERKIQEELQKGFQEGLIKGQTEAFNTQEEKYQAKIKELAVIMSSFEEQLKNIKQQIEEELPFQVTNVVLSIAKAVIKVEVQTNKEIIVQTVKDAIVTLPKDLQNIKCMLNSKDIETLTEIENPELKEQLTKFELVADDNIMQGGCFIKTLSSTLDARLENRVLEILTRVADERKHN